MRRRSAAYLAAGWAAAFAGPHLYWATGATAGLGTALSDDIVKGASTGIQLVNAAIAAFLLCGAVTALATQVSWPPHWRRIARRGLVPLVWFGALLLLARSVDIYVEFNLGLTGVRRLPLSHQDNYLHLARWFMFLWLPWFALGAAAWSRLALTYTRSSGTPVRSDSPLAPSVRGGSMAR